MTPFKTSLVLILSILGTFADSIEVHKAERQHPCGSVLTEPEGVLQYKPFETARPNERCVWILRVPETSGYNINFYNLGYPGGSSNNALHIAGFHRGDHTPKQTIPSRIDYNYFINGSVAILTYYSSSSRYERGFSLFWSTKSVPSNSTVVSPNSATVIVSDLNRNVTHPRNTTGLDKYDNNELSTFLFTPDFSWNLTSNLRNEIQFVQYQLENITCNDFIDIFIFNSQYSSTGWKTYGRFCGPDTDVTFTGNDMILLVFHSDSILNYDGFELKYRRVNAM